MSTAGTGELVSSDEEGGLQVPVFAERLPTIASPSPNHPINYPVQRIRIFTTSTSILIEIAGFNVQLTDQNLISIARELLNDPAIRHNGLGNVP